MLPVKEYWNLQNAATFLSTRYSGFDANELPLVKALHGEEDNVEIFIQNYKNPEGIFVVAKTARPFRPK
jgi:hypothetical protein